MTTEKLEKLEEKCIPHAHAIALLDRGERLIVIGESHFGQMEDALRSLSDAVRTLTKERDEVRAALDAALKTIGSMCNPSVEE